MNNMILKEFKALESSLKNQSPAARADFYYALAQKHVNLNQANDPNPANIWIQAGRIARGSRPDRKSDEDLNDLDVTLLETQYSAKQISEADFLEQSRKLLIKRSELAASRNILGLVCAIILFFLSWGILKTYPWDMLLSDFRYLPIFAIPLIFSLFVISFIEQLNSKKMFERENPFSESGEFVEELLSFIIKK